MIERLLETWLNRANERSFQIPFAHSLAYKGHTVLHVSRHCGMEIGKDIITVAPDGVPCAYQLKGVGGGRLTLSKWRHDLQRQLHPLVNCAIVHPSLTKPHPHRAYIVINGDFDEEVQREIDDFNQMNVAAGQPQRRVQTIVKGQLFTVFNELQSDFWATNIPDLKTYLELFLESGEGPIPKDKFAHLFGDALPFKPTDKKAPSGRAIARALAGCAVICSAALSAFTRAENHLAEFEAWTLFWCYAAGIAARWKVPGKKVLFATRLASESIYDALGRLCDELMQRPNLKEGDLFTDGFVYLPRVTHLLGLMSLYGLWIQRRLMAKSGNADRNHLDFVIRFCDEHQTESLLWGESAIPQLLALNFFRRTHDATLSPDLFYMQLVEEICRRNAPGSSCPLPTPYYDADDVMPHDFGLSHEPWDDDFSGQSHYLEGLLHLLVRTNLKHQVRLVFPDVTKIGFRSFEPLETWQSLLYRNGRGRNVAKFLTLPHRWSELKSAASECDGIDVPIALRADPLQYLAMLVVMPHRVSASGLRWLSAEMERQAEDKSWR